MDSINDLNSRLTEVKHELKEKIKFIANNKEYKYDLDAQKEAYKSLGLENLELKKKAKHYEEVCRSWCIASLKHEDGLNK